MSIKHLSPSGLSMLVLGHRGAISDHFGFYQNSLRAFEEAVEHGDGFETDACADRDGEIFLIHEAKYVDPAKGVEYCAAEHLDAVSIALMGGRRVDEMPTSEMRRLRLKDGSRVPTLKEAITLVGSKPGRILNIELKGYKVANPMLAVVRHGMRAGFIKPEALLISSFNHPALEIIRREAPEIAVGAIFIGDDQPSAPLFPWQPGSAGAYTALTPAAIGGPLLKKIKPDYIVMPQEIMTEETFSLIAAHHPQARCAGWIFTEKGAFDMPEFCARLDGLKATGKLGAMIVDNPREFIYALSR